jgi:hypothetical protein
LILDYDDVGQLMLRLVHGREATSQPITIP